MWPCWRTVLVVFCPTRKLTLCGQSHCSNRATTTSKTSPHKWPGSWPMRLVIPCVTLLWYPFYATWDKPCKSTRTMPTFNKRRVRFGGMCWRPWCWTYRRRRRPCGKRNPLRLPRHLTLYARLGNYMVFYPSYKP